MFCSNSSLIRWATPTDWDMDPAHLPRRKQSRLEVACNLGSAHQDGHHPMRVISGAWSDAGFGLDPARRDRLGERREIALRLIGIRICERAERPVHCIARAEVPGDLGRFA